MGAARDSAELAVGPRGARERAATTLLIMALRGSALAAKFGLTLFIVRFLDLEALGAYGLVAGAAVIVPALAGFGAIGVIGREAVTAELGAVTAALVPLWAMQAAFYAGATLVCLALGAGGVRPDLVLLVGGLLLLEHLNGDALVILNHRRQPRLANGLLMIRTVGWAGSYMALALLFPSLRSVPAILTFWLAGAGLSFLCFALACRNWPWRDALAWTGIFPDLGRTVARARHYYLNEIANTAGQYLDRYVVGALLGLEIAGAYFLFWSIANALSNIVDTSILQVEQPRIISRRVDPAGQRASLERLRGEAMLVALALAVVTGLLAFLGIGYLGRSLLEENLPVLSVLLAGFVLRIGYEVEGIGMYSRHDDRSTLLTALGVLAASAGLTLILTPLSGLYGPSLAMAGAYLLGTVWRRNRNVAYAERASSFARRGPDPASR